MKVKILIIISLIMLVSCDSLLKITIGKYYMNHLYNGGELDKETYITELEYVEKNGSIYLILNHGDKKYSFLFDTGGYSGISEKIIDEFSGYYTDLTTGSNDINGISQGHIIFCVDEIMLGTKSIKNMNFAIENYSNEDLDGVIGADFLSGKIFKFNLEKNSISFSNKKIKLDKINFKEFRIKKRWDKVYLLKIKLQNNTTKKFILDTGSDGLMKLSNSDVFLNPLREKKMLVMVQGAYSIHEKEVSYLQFKNFNCLSLNIDTATIIVSKDYKENLLGSPIFMNSLVVLDCIDNKIYLENRSINKLGQKIPGENISFGWVKDSLRVVQINPDMDKFGIKIFDQVIDINGYSTKATIEDFQKFIDTQKDSSFLDISFQRSGNINKVRLNKQQLGF